MAVTIQNINLGTVAGDGTGDKARAGGQKINDNFAAVKAAADLVLDIPQDRILGRVTASTGDAEKLTPTQVRTMLELQQNSGFIDRADSTISVVDGTRTVTIAPAVTSFSYWETDTKYTKSSAENIQFTDVEGLHFIYYDGPTLVHTTTFSDLIITEYAFVCVIYWDATNNQSIIFGDERHGHLMDSATHLYNHHTFGSRYGGGLSLGNMNTSGTGNNAGDAQFSVASGEMWDEDIRIVITDGSPQTLSTAAEVPIIYRSGASGLWRKNTATAFPVAIGATPLVQWNEWTGATWQLTEATSGNYVNYHYFSTNDTRHPIVGIPGQAEYSSIASAQAAAEDELTSLQLGQLELLGPEFIPIATVLFETKTSFSNAVAARTRPTADGDDYVDWRGVSGSGGGSGTGGAPSTDVDAIHDNVGNEIQPITSKSTMGSTDVLLIEDSAASWAKKSVTLSAIPHGELSDVGTNTHVQIDTHIALTNEHIDWTSATQNLSTSGTLAGSNFSGSSSGTNTGDQSSIVGITGTKAQFDTACTDGDFMFDGDAAFTITDTKIFPQSTVTLDNSSGGEAAYNFSYTVNKASGSDRGLFLVKTDTLSSDVSYLIDGWVSGVSVFQVSDSGDLILAEQADHGIDPTSGYGGLWVRNDTPNTLIFTDDAGTDHDLTAGGGGAFTADAQTQITPSTPIVLDEATGDEVAFDLSYVVNKATSGNSDGIFLDMTSTSAPGTDYLIRLQSAGLDRFRVSNLGVAYASNNLQAASAVYSTNAIYRISATDGMKISGGLINTGAIMKLFGGSHSTQADDIEFYTDTTVVGAYDASVPRWSLEAPLLLAEKAAAVADEAGYGQIWVKDDTPNTLMFTDDVGNDHDLTAGGGGAFTADAQTQITPTTPIVLDEATGDEVAFDLSYTVNKLTSGNSDGIYLNMTETSAPGVDYLIRLQRLGSNKFYVTNTGSGYFSASIQASTMVISSSQIYRTTSISSLLVSGGSTTTGGMIRLYGGSHSTQASDIEFLSSSSAVVAAYDHSVPRWSFETPLLLAEKSAAVADEAGYGQIWVKNDTPNSLWFTDDAGTDVQVSTVYDTFTPTITDSSNSDSEGQTYTTQNGRYWLVGDICYVWLEITMSSLGTLTTTDQVRIANLPFTSASGGAMMLGCAYASNLSLNAASVPVARVPGSQTYALLERQGHSTTGSSTITCAQLTASGNIVMQGYYQIA